MGELYPIVMSAFTGLVSGLLLSIPVGPVNLTIMNEAARRGFRWAVLIGLGASSMEVIYCAIAFTGFSSFFDIRMVKAFMEVFSFAFMLYLGSKFLLVKSVTSPTQFSAAADRIEGRIQNRVHASSAFMIGFIRTMANPGVLLFWIVLAANFMSHGWVEPHLRSKLICVIGVGVGTSSWFIGLARAAARGHGRLSEKTLLRMEHFSGFGLLALGLGHGVHIAWQLANHKM